MSEELRGRSQVTSMSEEANKRRLAAIQKRLSQVQRQKELMKKLEEGGAARNRVVFDSDSDAEAEGHVAPQAKAQVDGMEQEAQHKRKLFGDSSEDEDSDGEEPISELKPRFASKSAAKLQKLQQSFGGDERFRMDDTFADEGFKEGQEGEESDSDGSSWADRGLAGAEGAEEAESEMVTAEEKGTYLSVLTNLFPDETRFLHSENRSERWRSDKSMRYDPTSATAAQFEVDGGDAGVQEEGKGTGNERSRAGTRRTAVQVDVEAPRVEVGRPTRKRAWGEVTRTRGFRFGSSSGRKNMHSQDSDDESDDELGSEGKDSDGEDEDDDDDLLDDEQFQRAAPAMRVRHTVDLHMGAGAAGTRMGHAQRSPFFTAQKLREEWVKHGSSFRRQQSYEEVVKTWQESRKELSESYRAKYKAAKRRTRDRKKKRRHT